MVYKVVAGGLKRTKAIRPEQSLKRARGSEASSLEFPAFGSVSLISTLPIETPIMSGSEARRQRYEERFGSVLENGIGRRQQTLTDSLELYLPGFYGSPEVSQTESSNVTALKNGAIIMRRAFEFEQKRAPKNSVGTSDFPFVPSGWRGPVQDACCEFTNRKYREAMEDSVLKKDIVVKDEDGEILMSGKAYSLYDGHGPKGVDSQGQTLGKIAADRYAENVMTLFEDRLQQGDAPEKALLHSFKQVDFDSRGENWAAKAGSTGLFVFIPDSASTERTLYVANCGDSRALLCNQGEADALTYDHKASWCDDVDRERIENAGLKLRNGRVVDRRGAALAIHKTLGNWDFIEGKPSRKGHKGGVSGTPDISIVPLLPTDTELVLLCDGNTDVLLDQEIVDIVRQSSDLDAAVHRIVAAAVERGSRDNISAIVVKL